MKITIQNVPHMTERKQQEVGQALLFTLIHHNIGINGVTVTLDEEEY
jgi:hypothetical protein